ncbi:MAG TPA: 6-phosphogluconolactonase [Vicinamibacterales bacterium]|nr:6-phosphogluconolactonase [Vicinamibacterales bacterium]
MALLTIVDAASLVAVGAERLTELIEQAISRQGAARVSLTGGTTPRALYEALADPSRPWRRRIDWSRVHLYWGDERHVPPNDKDSNFGMADHALVAHVPIPARQVHRMRGELQDAHEAAREYERELPARFDLMLLGLGDNAHIASIFPGGEIAAGYSRAMKAKPADPAAANHHAADNRGGAARYGPPVTAVFVEALGVWRITLTPRPILESRYIVMYLAGENKAEAVEAAIERPLDIVRYPAQLLRDAGDRVEWIMDRSAAVRLRGVPPA